MKIPHEIARAEFGLDHLNEPVGTNDPVEAHIKAIDPGISPVERVIQLKPVIELIGGVPEPMRSAYLQTIKRHFGLTNKELQPYEEQVLLEHESRTTQESAEPPSDPEYRATAPGVIDLAIDQGKVVFLKLESGLLTKEESILVDSQVFVPPPISQIPWPLPSADKVIECFEQEQRGSVEDIDRKLFEDVVTQFRSVSELPSEDYYIFIAAWVIHTYLLDRFQYSPILCLFAVPERGKSRTGKALVYIAYRGIHVESLRESYIFRVADNFGATLFVDVMNVWAKAEKLGCEDILLSRFERGISVPRVIHPELGRFRDTEYYQVFGATVVATNEPVHHILGTRTIQINMPLSERRFENEITPSTFADLKIRLTAFRARHYGTDLTDVSKPARGRLGDITKPLLQIVRLAAPERAGQFRAFVDLIGAERAMERSEGLEAAILKCVSELRCRVVRGLLAVKAVTDHLNKGRHERERLSYLLVGLRLDALGFGKRRLSNGASGILYDQSMVDRLLAAHGLTQTSVTSVTSVTPEIAAPKPDDTDLTDDTEVSSKRT